MAGVGGGGPNILSAGLGRERNILFMVEESLFPGLPARNLVTMLTEL